MIPSLNHAQSTAIKVNQGKLRRETVLTSFTLTLRILIFLFCLLALASFSARATDAPVQLVGVYKTIDIRLARETIRLLAKSKDNDRQVMLKRITEKPEIFAPPVLYYASQILFEEDKKDDAVFWFYAGQLRARIDANICADKSVRGAVNALNEKFGQSITQYAFQNIPELTNTVEKVITWEATTPCNYDRRWINLEGANAISGETNAPLSAPDDQWEKIRKNTREEFRSTFYQSVTDYNKKHPPK